MGRRPGTPVAATAVVAVALSVTICCRCGCRSFVVVADTVTVVVAVAVTALWLPLRLPSRGYRLFAVAVAVTVAITVAITVAETAAVSAAATELWLPLRLTMRLPFALPLRLPLGLSHRKGRCVMRTYKYNAMRWLGRGRERVRAGKNDNILMTRCALAPLSRPTPADVLASPTIWDGMPEVYRTWILRLTILWV